MAISSNSDESEDGIRTYRGKTLDELLPQIRTELGADAVILREREGLVGGVGGFFAQRFVEVDARRGDGSSIDVYDDAGDELLLPPPDFVEDHGPRDPGDSIDVEATEPQANGAAPQLRRLETNVFLERLREASQALPPDDVDAERSEPAAVVELHAAPEPTVPAPEVTEPETADREAVVADEPKAAVAEPEVAEPDVAEPVMTEPEIAEPEGAEPPNAPERPSRRQARERPQRPARPERPQRPERPERRREDRRARDRRPEPEPVAPAAENPYATVRPRPRIAEPLVTTPQTSVVPSFPPRAPGPQPRSTAQTAPQTGILRSLIGNLFGRRRRAAAALRPQPPVRLDPAAVSASVAELSARGASPAWASQLIEAAGAHGTPLAPDLQTATRAEVWKLILSPPSLPATGAAIAFIGGGGAGKTRCTAALASAYRRASTLATSVISLEDPEGARQLRELLAEDGVPVLELDMARARQAVVERRSGGIVIVDTPACTPTNPEAIETLRAKLGELGLDAVYVTLPATLGPQAARRALANFGALKPSAVTITHTDETDQLAVIIEIATAHRIPLAHIHSGTDHRRAITAVDPRAIAELLLA